ncbi:hypothetical protein SAY87_007879 [Trapa incisa]|uniref:Phosphoribosylformylglycinamidine synthase N-terminal domain-containing protein n=1 Tax=Trapa incisa TaxID=236973 RepID=A0AAN7KNU2_9MYRT|nr:hypothetical protein SAY87_007879 [Trapa incisa]
MAAACEVTVADFLKGTSRKTLFLQKNLPKRTQRLWGSVQNQKPMTGSRRRISLRCCAQANPGAVIPMSLVDDNSRSNGKTADLVLHFYRIPLIQDNATAELLRSIQTRISDQIVGLRTEQCFNIRIESGLSAEMLGVLRWLLQETYEPENFGPDSFLEKKQQEGLNSVIIEVGPRLSFTTAWSANAVSICQVCGLSAVTRVERSRRYLLYLKSPLMDHQINEFSQMVHDRMSECVYSHRLTSFETSVVPEEVQYVPLMEKGRKALEEINEKMGLAFDEQDLQYYTRLFMEDIKRSNCGAV